jgi:hypothetical protein
MTPGDGSARRAGVLLLLALTGCPKAQAPSVQVAIGAERTEGSLAPRVSAGAAGPGALFGAGTPRGGVLLRRGDGSAHPLGAQPLHEGPVVSLAFSADGRRLISAGGRTVAAWDVEHAALVRRVSGPQGITAAVLDESGQVAYFSTSQGHVLRWPLGSATAEPQPQLACAAAAVTVAQMRLPEERRCAFGTYVEPPTGKGMCAYPITALILEGTRLARACREGTLVLTELRGGSPRYYLAGYLRTLTSVGELLLLGRGEGELRLYDPTSGTVRRELLPAGPADAAAARGAIVAVAQGSVVRLWHVDSPTTLASAPLPARAVWLGLFGAPDELRLLLEDGRLISRPLTVSSR